MSRDEKFDLGPLREVASAVLARPLLFIIAGLGIIAVSTMLLFGGSASVRDSEAALEQARRVVSELSATVESFRRLLRDEQVQTLAGLAMADPETMPELRSYISGRMQEVGEVRLYALDVALLESRALGENDFIILDMLMASREGGLAPVQVLTDGGEQWLGGATVIGEVGQPQGYLLVLAELEAALDKFNVTLPDAGYISLEHMTGNFSPVTLREFGTGMPAGYLPVRLRVPDSLLRVVVPQASDISTFGTFERLLLFVLGTLLLAYGVIRRQVLVRSSVEFQPDPEAMKSSPRPRREEPRETMDESRRTDREERDSAPGADPAPTDEEQAPEEPTESEVSLPDIHRKFEQRLQSMHDESSGVELTSGIFRAYDIRGVVGQSVDAGVAFRIGQAVGSLALEREASPVVVGRDGRHSGPELVDGLVGGLKSTGCDVIDVGAVPTGALYFAAYELGSGSGVMVTGSHNPPDYNGFKVMIGGRTLSGDEITGLYDRLEAGEILSGQGSVKGEDVLERYRKRIAGDIQLERPIKVVADCGNGIGGVCAAAILRAIGANVLPLFDEVDGTFPNHHPDPSEPENLKDLVESVQVMDADLGVAFDGDADRLGVVTPDGRIVYADRLMMLFAREILERNPGATIIYDVKCTGHLGTVISEAGGHPEMWKTGHSLIKNRMKEVGAPFAGEMSGHFFFQDRWYGFDCGIYSACRLLEILARDDRAPGEVLASLPDSVSTPELKVKFEEGENHRFIERFQSEAVFPDARITTIDGVRADFADGWGLARASNTTPVVVLRFDADSEEALKRVQEAFREQLLAIREDLELPF